MFRGKLHESGNDQTRNVGILTGGVQSNLISAHVVLAQRGARLHGTRHDAVVNEFDFGDMVGAIECRIGGRLVTDLPVVADIARGVTVHLRRIALHGIDDRRYGRQRCVTYRHLLGRVLRLMVALGDYHGDRITNVAHGVECQQWMRRCLVGLAVFAGNGPAADQSTQSRFGNIGAAVHCDDAWHLRRGGDIDGESGMGVGRAEEIGVNLTETIHVVQVSAISGKKTIILFAAHRSADSGIGHDYFPPSRIARAPAWMDLTMFW